MDAEKAGHGPLKSKFRAGIVICLAHIVAGGFVL
jgi:hypothetical protein